MNILLFAISPLYCLNTVLTLPDIYPAKPIPFTEVELFEGFWKKWITIVGTKFVPHNLQYCESEKKIDNFRVASGKKEGKHHGACFEDSDVYKVIEGAAYWLALNKDPKLEQQIDEIINLIAGSQQPDGYLNTYFTLVKPHARWTNDAEHETYCAGHLIESAIAYYQATGKRKLLDVAIKLADHIVDTFGPGKVEEVPQHEEIELALFKLTYFTKDEKYAKLAQWFIEQRGKPYKDKPNGRWGFECQDHKPIIEQDAIMGHAVRAMYLYSAVVDLIARNNDQRYASAIDKLWYDLTERKMYITAGIGDSKLRIEGFSEPYYLPNDTAYCETCASIGLVLWAQRLFLLYRDAQYVDVIERAIYNTPLSGLSLNGDAIFYCNRLEGSDWRPPWQSCACCPTNVVRFIPTIHNYAYAIEKDTLYILQYMPTSIKLAIQNNHLTLPTTTPPNITLTQHTNYPWEGDIKFTVEVDKPTSFQIAIRIPDWVYRGANNPERLYIYPDSPGLESVQLSVDNTPIPIQSIHKGFVILNRQWQGKTTIHLHLPMKVQRVYAHPNVEANRGRVAIQRGPIVYCAEDIDNHNNVRFIFLPRESTFSDQFENDLLNGVVTITTTAKAKTIEQPVGIDQTMKLIPYYAWANRQRGFMRVWIPETPELIPTPTIESIAHTSASHVWPNDSLSALNDQIEPKASSDTSIPRFTWWDHKGTTEWVQYSWDQEITITGAKVYWFDDTGFGECRVPQSWQLLYQKDNNWVPIRPKDKYTTTKHTYNTVEFEPIRTNALRLEVQLQPNFSGGILEWKLITKHD